jgi:penicillin-binding protein 1A
MEVKEKHFLFHLKKERHRLEKVGKIYLDRIRCVVLGISGLFFAVSQGFLGEMPDVKELENPNIYVASEIISSDGVVLGKFEKEKTQPIIYKDLPLILCMHYRQKKMNVLKNIQELT